MSFPRYPKYKESGVEWLTEVPDHWSVKRLRFVAKLNPSKSEVATLDRTTLVSFLPMEAIGDDGTLRLDQEKPIGEVDNGYTYFREGDVTIAKITPCYENGKGALMRGLVNKIGFGTTELTVARPKPDEVAGSYLHYLFTSPDFRAIGESHMYGAGGQKRVPDAFIKNFTTAWPPIREQAYISAFLERETAKIDALVAEQVRLMELLHEKRQAVIFQAVTKGLNPAASMKSSGIEWIGCVPDHWGIRPLKYACKLETGHTPRKSVEEYWVLDECSIPWVSLNDTKTLAAADFIDDTAIRISALGMSNSSAHLIQAGAVVMNRDGARVGLAAILTKPMCVSQHIVAWVCGPSVSNYYLLHVIYAMNDEIYRITTGSTIPTIGMPDVKRMTMPLPPLEEQVKIVEYILKARQRFSELTAEAEKAIELLQERRSALIAAAVTGQIDVRPLLEKEPA